MINKGKTGKIIIWTVFAVYIIVLLRLTVFRRDFLAYGLLTHGSINVVPFEYYLRLLRARNYTRFIYLFGGNIAWFVPLGFLLPYLTGVIKKLGHILLIGFLLSFTIELSQYIFGTGASDLDDLILNTFGAAVGFCLFMLSGYIRKKKKTGGGNDAAET